MNQKKFNCFRDNSDRMFSGCVCIRKEGKKVVIKKTVSNVEPL